MQRAMFFREEGVMFHERCAMRLNFNDFGYVDELENAPKIASLIQDMICSPPDHFSLHMNLIHTEPKRHRRMM
jgi:hypothetical protein